MVARPQPWDLAQTDKVVSAGGEALMHDWHQQHKEKQSREKSPRKALRTLKQLFNPTQPVWPGLLLCVAFRLSGSTASTLHTGTLGLS